MKIATAPTKERLLTLINQFYYTSNCIINESNEVINTKLNKTLGMVKESKKRFEYHSFEFKN
jgi:hypothetical protein